jgi:uncharacterized membrane protein
MTLVAERLPGQVEPQAIDDWIAAHFKWIALLVIAAGFILRILIASQTFLVPDEAMFYRAINQHDLHTAYRESLSIPHPPLLILMLYWVHLLSRTELALRLPFVLAGTASLWFFFRWFRQVLNDRAALIGLVLLAFSPTLMVLSAEARHYPQLLFFLAVALDSLERAFSDKSAGWMALSGAALSLAIASQYSAIWTAVVLGIYALWRIWRGELPGRLVAVWAGTQTAVVAVCGALYVTHISPMRHAEWVQGAINSYLTPQYFQAEKDHLVPFAVVRTADFFMYLFAQDTVGAAMLAVFFVGILLLALDKVGVQDGHHSRERILLFVLPFVAGSCGAIAGLYPYGGTRHGIYLAPFAVAGASVALAWIARGRVWLSVLIAASIMAVCFLARSGPPEYIRPENQRKALMVDAVKYIRQSIPTGHSMLVDGETSLMLQYYFCPNEIQPADDQQGHPFQFSCGGYRIFELRLWGFTPSNFAAKFQEAARGLGFQTGERIVVMKAGWNDSSEDKSLFVQLAARQPGMNQWPHQDFGDNISIFQLPAGGVTGSP